MWALFQKYQPAAAAKWISAGGAAKQEESTAVENVSVSDAHCWRIEQKQKEEVVQCCSRDVITVILSSRTTVWNYRADPLWSCSELRVGITRVFLLLAAGQWAETTKELQRDEGRTDGRVRGWTPGGEKKDEAEEEEICTAALHWTTDDQQLVSRFHRNKTKECN